MASVTPRPGPRRQDLSVRVRLPCQIQCVDAEIQYLRSQRLGRLATVGHDGMPPPWQPPAVEVRGPAATLDTGGKAILEGFDDPIIRIRPAAGSTGLELCWVR
jgi:hypothetical protein